MIKSEQSEYVPFSPASWGNFKDTEAFVEHIEKHLGPITKRRHCVSNQNLHIILYFVDDSPSPGLTTVVTYSLADRGLGYMNGRKMEYYPEAVAVIPKSWPQDEPIADDNRYSWPLYWLTVFSLYQFKTGRILQSGDTMASQNGDDEPLNEHTNMYGHFVTPPVGLPRDFWTLKYGEQRTIFFFSLFPLYKEELEGKIAHGSDWLFERLEKSKILPYFAPDRVNVGSNTTI